MHLPSLLRHLLHPNVLPPLPPCLHQGLERVLQLLSLVALELWLSLAWKLALSPVSTEPRRCRHR